MERRDVKAKAATEGCRRRPRHMGQRAQPKTPLYGLDVAILPTGSSPMKIVECEPRRFGSDPVRTEADSRAALLAKPLAADVTYLSVPWSILINQRRTQKFAPIDCDGGFAICQHVRFREIVPLLKQCRVRVLFTPHAVRDFPGLDVRGMPHSPAVDVVPSAKRWLYSFVGFVSHPVRRALFGMRHPANTVMVMREHWHFGRRRCGYREREFGRILSQSRFSLCPRGSGPGTIRFWESLCAGAIPVLIADGLKLPVGPCWEDTVVRCPEGNVQDLEEIIRGIDPEREALLRRNCLLASETFARAGLVEPVRQYYRERINGA